VDPTTDTPAVLKAFAHKHGADYPDWRFLTGPLDRLRSVVVDGFKQGLQVGEAPEGGPPNILHGSHFVLVDRAGFIRGYYSSDEPGIARLNRDTRLLIAERTSP
jgi:protein SCO1/2